MAQENIKKADMSGVNRAKWWQVLGFSFNNASTNAVYLVFMLYFLVYSTSIYGFSALLVGAIMTGARLFDAVTDPIIGLLIDRTDTKFGRFRPWILGGSIVSAATFVLMFSGIKTGSQAGDLAMIIGLYVVWVIGYTAQTACTKSAQTIVSSVPQQRSMVNALGQLYTVVLYMFAMAAGMPIINAMGGTSAPEAWRFIGLIFAAIQLLFGVFTVLGLKGKDVKENYIKLDVQEKAKIKDYLKLFGKNKALQMLVVAASTNKIAQTMVGSLTVLFYFYVSKNQALQSTVSMMTLPIMILTTFLIIPIIKKYGRKETFSISSWGGFVFGIVAIFLVYLNPSNMIWLVLVMGINMVLIAGTGDTNLISMIGDAADYHYYKYGKFIPGMIGTAFSLIDKLVSSFGALIIGTVLTSIGFINIDTTPQTSTMFWAVLIMFFGLPAIGHLFSIIGMKFHPLDKKTHEKMVVELAKRKEEKAQEVA